MGQIDENMAYLKDVLGMKYLGTTEGQQASGQQAAVQVSDPAPTLEGGVNSLAELEGSLAGCTLCKLNQGRKTIVFGTGNPQAQLLFVGEGPGEQEDIQGKPFVGPAGQLLTKMIEAMGLRRDDVYIANVVKCRPPGNRNPEPDEIEKCSPFLMKQIEMINPKIIVALGKFAAQTLLKTEEKISRLRGKTMEFHGRKLVATFHPSYLLRNPAEKKAAWTDLKLVMKELEKLNS